MARVLELPDTERELVTWLMRRDPATVADVAAQLDRDEATCRVLLDDLAKRGFLTVDEGDSEHRYAARPAARSRRSAMPPDVWQALDGLGVGRRGRK